MDSGLPALIFHIIFLARRVIVVSVAFWMDERPYFQLVIFMLAGLLTMCYMAAVKPFSSPHMGRIELFNEFVILLIVYIYVTLLVAVYDIKELTNFGHILNSLIALIVLANFSLMIF